MGIVKFALSHKKTSIVTASVATWFGLNAALFLKDFGMQGVRNIVSNPPPVEGSFDEYWSNLIHVAKYGYPKK